MEDGTRRRLLVFNKSGERSGNLFLRWCVKFRLELDVQS